MCGQVQRWQMNGQREGVKEYLNIWTDGYCLNISPENECSDRWTDDVMLGKRNG